MAVRNEHEAFDSEFVEFKRECEEGRFPYFYANDAARAIGYENYDEAYLGSDLWLVIRERVLKREGNQCQGCNRIANVVHHRRYTKAILRGQDDSQLFCLCHNCHDYVEFGSNHYLKSDDGRYKYPEKDKRLEELIRLRPYHEQTLQENLGICVRCKCATESDGSKISGRTYLAPTERGDNLLLWLCDECCRDLSFTPKGKPRSDEQKIRLLKRKRR